MRAPADHHRPGRGERLRAWAFSAAPAAGRAGAWGRSCARILLIMHAEYFRTHITIRASALTFAILLSIVPLLALSTSILKGLGTDAQLRQAAVRVIEQLVPPPPAAPGDAPPPPAELPAKASFSAHLHHAVDLVFDYVDRTNFAALGLIGVIGLIVVVLLVLASIEDAMNAIWHTRRGRSLLRKLMDYLALLLLLPLSINIALAAEAIVASRRIMEQVSLIVPSAWLAALLIKLVPFLCVVLTLMFLYLFFPHTRVHTGAAFAGALFAAVFWFIAQKIYVALQVGVANYNAIYGSFATIPLMLVWLQTGWTFILLGAVLAHAVQHHRHYRPRGAVLSPQRQLQTALEVLQAVYADFARRQPTRRTRRSHPGHRPGGDRDRGPTARPRRSARPSRGQWRGDADAGDAGGKPARGRARPAGAR
jgi:membrane protein